VKWQGREAKLIVSDLIAGEGARASIARDQGRGRCWQRQHELSRLFLPLPARLRPLAQTLSAGTHALDDGSHGRAVSHRRRRL
jgi:hypothetical protein